MSIGSMLTNPVVLIGGGAIGLVLLMSGKGGGGGAAVDPMAAYTPQFLSANVAMNAAALGAQTEQMEIQADVAKAGFARDNVQQAQMLSFLKSVDDNNTAVRVNSEQTGAGVTQAVLRANADVIVDQQQNAARLGLGYIELAKADIQADASVDIARYQYKGAKVAAKASLFGNVVKSVTTLGTKAITGGFG